MTLKPVSSPTGGPSTTTWERMPNLPVLTPLHRRFIGFRRLTANEVKNEKGEILPGPAGGLATGGTTADEALAIFRTYNTYFGPYFFHDTGEVVVHQRAGSFNPNTIADVPRRFTLDGDSVTLMPPPTTQGGVVERQGYLTWELVRESPARR